MQRFNINWTAKALANQMEKGKVNYDNAVQRNLVWDAEKKSLLIHSMIYAYAIPAMYFTRDGINSKIASLGATAGSSVTRKTSYVICGEKPGSKLTKARELGIPVLTEQEFLSMIPA